MLDVYLFIYYFLVNIFSHMCITIEKMFLFAEMFIILYASFGIQLAFSLNSDG